MPVKQVGQTNNSDGAVQFRKPKIRTMEDLSHAIGISRPTLSKYFRDADSVRKNTRLRIEAALETVDYVPNFFATKMNRKSTGLIGVIVHHLNDMFISSLIEAIEARALTKDYMVITQNSNGDPAVEAEAVQNLMSMSADGVIVAPLGERSSIAAIRRLKDALPVVFVDSRFPDEFQDVDFVGTNNTQSISVIIDYLCRSGEPPVFLPMPPLNSNGPEREQAYRTHMQKLGFSPEVISTGDTPSTWKFEEFAYEIMDAHFNRGKFVDRTILCANDLLAFGAIRAANNHKLFSSRDGEGARFRIAGHDDHPLSAYMQPGLTTVVQKTTEIGKAAVDQVFDQMQRGKRNGEGVERTFDAELRLRNSA
ncbi:MAG: LacI family DNA-binding transcriptional regulator [Boseongicola sp.]